MKFIPLMEDTRLWNDEIPEATNIENQVADFDPQPDEEGSPDPGRSGVHYGQEPIDGQSWSSASEGTNAKVYDPDGERSLSHTRGRRPTLPDAGPSVQPFSHFKEYADPTLLQQAPAFNVHRSIEIGYEKSLADGAPVALAVLFEGMNRMKAYQYDAESRGAMETAIVADVNLMKMAERVMHYNIVNKQGKEPVMNWQEDIPDYMKYSPAVREKFEKKMAEAEVELEKLAEVEALEQNDEPRTT